MCAEIMWPDRRSRILKLCQSVPSCTQMVLISVSTITGTILSQGSLNSHVEPKRFDPHSCAESMHEPKSHP